MVLLPDKRDTTIVSASMSEGKDSGIIDNVAKKLEMIPNVKLINVDPNRHYNFTNFIFGGPPETVLQAAMEISLNAFRHIDLRKQSDVEQSHLGVIDLLSFIPLYSENMNISVKLAKKFGKEIAGEANIPVYLFGRATKNKKRQDIRYFRQFSTAELPGIMKKREWRPDYGPARFNEALGIMISGARCYHINIAIYFDTEDIELINELTELHKLKLLENNTPARPSWKNRWSRNFEKISTMLKKVNTYVDDMPDEKIVRLTCNIPDYNLTPVTAVIDMFKEEAMRLGIEVLGNQVLGYLPAEVLIRAGKKCHQENPGKHLPDHLAYIELAIEKLQLHSIEPFDLKRQVLDYHFEIDSDHV